MPKENDYRIQRKSRIIPGKTLTLYKLEESPDAMLRYRAVEILRARGMREGEAHRYLNSLEYAPTRGG
jgi:hypothetical protein